MSALFAVVSVYSPASVLAHDTSPSSNSSPAAFSSVHRFSNLYGTVLSCGDFLSSSHLLAHNSDSHHLSSSSSSSSFSLNGVPLDLRTLLRSHLLNYRDDIRGESAHHSSNGHHRFNATIRWEVRAVANYRTSASSSSSSNRAGAYEYAHNRAGLRYGNIYDGTLSFAPFDVGAFVPDIHDAYYRCLLHLQQGVLASREVRLQAGKCTIYCSELLENSC